MGLFLHSPSGTTAASEGDVPGVGKGKGRGEAQTSFRRTRGRVQVKLQSLVGGRVPSEMNP